jgi:hypothetical protein
MSVLGFLCRLFYNMFSQIYIHRKYSWASRVNDEDLCPTQEEEMDTMSSYYCTDIRSSFGSMQTGYVICLRLHFSNTPSCPFRKSSGCELYGRAIVEHLLAIKVEDVI